MGHAIPTHEIEFSHKDGSLWFRLDALEGLFAANNAYDRLCSKENAEPNEALVLEEFADWLVSRCNLEAKAISISQAWQVREVCTEQAENLKKKYVPDLKPLSTTNSGPSPLD